MNGNRFVAEGVGTFALVFAGCGAVTVNDTMNGVLGHVGVSLIFGLVVMAMIYSIGNVSGAHINPAVTISFWISGQIERRDASLFIGCQVTGALTAALVLRLLFPEHETLGSTIPAESVGWIRAFSWEMLLTFFLMFVIFNVSTGHMEKGIMAGVAVGGTVAMEALLAGPVTGASMNPARSIGPALISGKVDSLWIYIVAPITGAILAFPISRIIQGTSGCEKKPAIDPDSMNSPHRILFLCHGNSCRSQMAEGFCRHLHGNDLLPSSAGVVAKGIDPLAIAVMSEVGIDISGQESKTIEDLGQAHFDFVVTVCGEANEACPYFPAKTRVIHRGFDDPPRLAQTAADREEALNHYRTVRDEIQEYIRSFPTELETGSD